MSLVDYASSSDDEVSEDKQVKLQNKPQIPKQEPLPSTNPKNTNPSSSINNNNDSKLPDASVLLNSPSISSSSISTASRKRESSQMACSRSKLQKGRFSHSKSIPDTDGGVKVIVNFRDLSGHI
ncbi:conserved hypothetical protein [Ricinus communis]|uniref:Uncharacterized protein n=1 Tax=Ricinus communis TaxID=3988 RepID=B9S9F4_RICCO|nr:conserved hypothetical protein [Ricinus communis]